MPWAYEDDHIKINLLMRIKTTQIVWHLRRERLKSHFFTFLTSKAASYYITVLVRISNVAFGEVVMYYLQLI